MNTKEKYLSMCFDANPVPDKTTLYILDHETYRMPNGHIFITHSRPTEPAPDGRFDSPEYGWHDVPCKWVKLEDIDKPCVADV